MCLTSSIVIMTFFCCTDILPSNVKVFGLTYVGRTWTSFFLLPECVTEKKYWSELLFTFPMAQLSRTYLKPLQTLKTKKYI